MSDVQIKFTYKPEGIEPRIWVIDLIDQVKASEYIAVRKVTQGEIGGASALMDGVQELDLLAIKALLWLLLKRSMSTLSFDELDFTLGEVEIASPDETPGALRARLERLKAQDALNELGVKMLAGLVADGVEAEAEDEDPKV